MSTTRRVRLGPPFPGTPVENDPPNVGRVEVDHDILNLSATSIDRNALDRTIHYDLSDDDALVGHETSLA
jgi:hypothetical protein